MMSSLIYITLTLISVLIISLLGLYAFALYVRVREKDAQQKKSANTLSRELAKRQVDAENSIRVIASALTQGQVGLTEGAIRISKLSLFLGERLQSSSQYQIFSKLAEDVAHIPILENWKKLSKLEKTNFEQEKKIIEENLRDSILSSAQKIVDFHLKNTGDKSPLFHQVGKK
jgi:hypothetical protein